MTLRDLERASGVSNSEISKIESGSQDCRLESFVKISIALGIPFGRLLDDLVLPDFPGYSDRILTETLLLDVTASCVELRPAFALNMGMIAAWAAHLIQCGHPILRARRVVYYSEALYRSFESFARFLDALEDFAARREMLSELSVRPGEWLLKRGIGGGELFVDMAKRLLGEDGRPLVLDGSALALLGIRSTSLLWFPFFPQEFNQPACPAPAFGSIIKIDETKQVADNSLVSLTWKELKRRLKKVTAERGKKAAAADFAGVDRSNMNRWLDDDQEPGAEAAFRLLEWVTAEEAKQKSSVGALTPPEPKTQPKDIDENVNKSGRRKK